MCGFPPLSPLHHRIVYEVCGMHFASHGGPYPRQYAHQLIRLCGKESQRHMDMREYIPIDKFRPFLTFGALTRRTGDVGASDVE